VTAVRCNWLQQVDQTSINSLIVFTTEATFFDPWSVITLRVISNYKAPDNNKAHLLQFNITYRRDKQ
jgi:hypothetical protein